MSTARPCRKQGGPSTSICRRPVGAHEIAPQALPYWHATHTHTHRQLCVKQPTMPPLECDMSKRSVVSPMHGAYNGRATDSPCAIYFPCQYPSLQGIPATGGGRYTGNSTRRSLWKRPVGSGGVAKCCHCTMEATGARNQGGPRKAQHQGRHTPQRGVLPRRTAGNTSNCGALRRRGGGFRLVQQPENCRTKRHVICAHGGHNKCTGEQ